MKKIYMTPVFKVVKIQHQSRILNVSNISGNTNLNYGGSYDSTEKGEARVQESTNIWDDEW